MAGDWTLSEKLRERERNSFVEEADLGLASRLFFMDGFYIYTHRILRWLVCPAMP